MNRFAILKNAKVLARAGIMIIFLALIRTLAEVLRLQHYTAAPLTYQQIYPFVIGALFAAVCLFAMMIALFSDRYKVVILLAVLAAIGLLLIKWIYLQ